MTENVVVPSSYQDVVSQRDSLLEMLKLLIVSTDLHYTSIDVRNKARDLVQKIEGVAIDGRGHG